MKFRILSIKSRILPSILGFTEARNPLKFAASPRPSCVYTLTSTKHVVMTSSEGAYRDDVVYVYEPAAIEA